MKKGKKWLSRIISIVFVIVFIFGAYVCIKVVGAGRNGVPEIFGYSFLKVQSGSMTGTIDKGDIILVRKALANDVKVGDIISFYSTDPSINGIPNTHRVVAIDKDESGEPVFTTRGDNNPSDDRYKVYSEKLIGIYQGKLKIFNKLLSLFQNRFAFFFLLIIPLMIIAVVEFLNVMKVAKSNPEIPQEAGEGTQNDEKDSK